MAPLSLWRYEVGRTGWAALLTPPVCAALVVLLAVLQAAEPGGKDEVTARLLIGVLEVSMPLAVGVGAASLVGRDSAVELALTTLRSYRTTLLRRLAITFGWAAALAVGTTVGLLVSGWWYRLPSAPEPVLGQLIWLAPAISLGGLGFLLGALLRGPAAAGGLVAGVWIVQLATAGAWPRPLYLFATTRGRDQDWLTNRVVLLATGVALLVAGWLVLARTERLVKGDNG